MEFSLLNAEEKSAAARELFLSGCNCAQAVAAAFAPEMNLSKEDVLTIMLGFGGGFGGLRTICGTISGMTMVISRMLGVPQPDAENKKAVYAVVRKAAEAFQSRYETLECKALLISAGIAVKTEPSERTPEYYRTRPCTRYVETAAAILCDVLNEAMLGVPSKG